MSFFLYKLVLVGETISLWESLVAYALPIAFLCYCPTLSPLFWWNIMCQLALFIPVVQIPALLTGKMAYVDIGWPMGLVILALNCLVYGTGWYVRKYVMGICLLFHGGRMMLGGLAMFYPYTFPNGDLSRYQYAKKRWVDVHKLSDKLWFLKQQHDTLQQCFANCIVLACPFFVCISDPTPYFHPIELFGVGLWITAYIWENTADIQKNRFLKDCIAQGKKATTPEEKAELRKACLGVAPYNTSRYYLWTLTRHPNYLGELMCWVGFSVASLGSLTNASKWLTPSEVSYMIPAVIINNIFLVRFFYDCLVYWTGAAPAEQQSVVKRPEYREYQRTTPVLFPCKVPFLDDHKEPGWPLNDHTSAAKHK